MTGGGRRRTSQSMYRDGDFVAYESSIVYLQDTVTNRSFFIGDYIAGALSMIE